MAQKNPSGSFVHAAQFASLMLQVSEHLFPASKLFELSEDQRRMVQTEASNLLLRARWFVDSQQFANHFGQAQIGGPLEAPANTVLGQPPAQGQTPANPPTNPGGSGTYL